jgi:hypothetical protein
LLRDLSVGEQNAVLPALAAGGELRYLLDKLPAHRAVYVFEDDLRVVAAVLRAADYACDIETGRCILVPPGDEAAFLEHQLSAHPGLLPPGLIICLSDLPPERLGRVRATCEQTAQVSHAARSRRLGELALAPVPVAAPADAPRLALLALRPDPLAQRVARCLENAARQLDWPVLLDAVRTPRDVHALAHAERLASFSPSLVLCLGHSCDLRLAPTVTVFEWHLRSNFTDGIRGDEVLKLAASPHLSDLLRMSCPAGSRVVDWYWGCEPPNAISSPADVVLLIGDLVDNDPARAGIEQPSHRLVWKHAERCITRLWADGEFVRPSVVLKQAERAAGLALPPGEARTALLRAIEYTLIPGTLLRTIRQVLSSGAFEFGTLGQGWKPRADSEKEAVAFCNLWEFVGQTERYRPIAAVFAGIHDPLSPELLQAGALGWPLLLYGPGGPVTAAGLGPTLRAGDYRTFIDPRSLMAAVQDLRRDPASTWEGAASTGQYLSAQHSYKQRLRQLHALVH